MASGRCVGAHPDGHTFLCKFWHFHMAVSQWKLAWLTPNLGILCISVSSFRLCESIVANPIIYRLVPRPSRFETRQWNASCKLKTNKMKEASVGGFEFDLTETCFPSLGSRHSINWQWFWGSITIIFGHFFVFLPQIWGVAPGPLP